MIVNKPVKKKKMSRYTVLCIIMGVIFGTITLRLLYLQVFSYEEYKEKANTTSTRFVSESAPRGGGHHVGLKALEPSRGRRSRCIHAALEGRAKTNRGNLQGGRLSLAVPSHGTGSPRRQ